jgi:uncharacterized protein (DUF58 family)
MGEDGGGLMDPLIDEAFLQQLTHLKFIVKGRRKGHLAGAHPSPRAGVSLEFADYRDYTPGDDFRYIDWKIVGRLDRVLVKMFVREVDLPIALLLDLSASMHLGDPPKVTYAARLAAALAYLGLRELDRVGLYPFTDHLLPAIAPRHGMSQMAHILRALHGVSPRGRTSLDRVLTEFVAHSRESGLVFLISDLLSEDGYEEGFSRLLHRGDEVVVIQVVDPEELHPTVSGSTRITDSETLRHLDLTVGERTRAQYERRLTSYLTALHTFLADHRIPYILAPTDLPLDRLIHERLRKQGVLK